MNWTGVVNWLGTYGWRILIVIIVAVALYVVLRRVVPRAIRRTVCARMRGQAEEDVKQRVDTLNRIVVDVGIVVILIMAVFTILAQVGVNITAAVAGLGIVGVAVGFGAQTLVRDYLAGLFILLENQYCVGDVVRIAGVMGFVEEINLRRTILRDLDGAEHHIPNGEVRVASNFTKEWSRANMLIGVAYKEDLDQVMRILRDLWRDLKNDPQWGEFILREEPTVVRVDEFGDSGISIRLTGETKPL